MVVRLNLTSDSHNTDPHESIEFEVSQGDVHITLPDGREVAVDREEFKSLINIVK